MKEELSLIAVILIIFLADLFMDPEKRNTPGHARFATLLPIALLIIHTVINLVPAAGNAEAFGGMYQYTPMQTIIKEVRDIIEITAKDKKADKPDKKLSRAERMQLIEQLTKEMKNAARLLEFEHAAFLRDRIDKLRNMK